MGGWLGGNQVKNHAISWSNFQDWKISSRVEIPKLDQSVAINQNKYDGEDICEEKKTFFVNIGYFCVVYLFSAWIRKIVKFPLLEY